MQHRARTLTLIATCAFATLSLTGCGGADSQYANDGALASGSYGGSVADQAPSGSSSLFGLDDYDIGSGVASDTSIDGTINASYGSVPGALQLSSDGTTLGTDDDVTSSTPFDSIALDDPTASTTGLFGSGDASDVDSTIDGLASSTDTNFDSAMNNAQDAYGEGAMAAFAPTFEGDPVDDPSVDDPSLDVDPTMDTGPDSMPDF
jgi:hypothetical protein